jgi:hypothetical protein
VNKIFVIFLSLFYIGQLWADDCLVYKNIPRVIIEEPDYTTHIVQPNKNMDLWHGNVVATMIDNYDIITDVKPVDNGYCVILKTVKSIFGYNDFLVNIDIRHTPDTCAYNAILEHEKKHIKQYLSVINDFKKELQNSIFNASDSIMPIFIKSKSDVSLAVDKMNLELQSHPDLIIIKQKIKAAEEIRNKKVDQNNNKSELKKCFN